MRVLLGFCTLGYELSKVVRVAANLILQLFPESNPICCLRVCTGTFGFQLGHEFGVALLRLLHIRTSLLALALGR